MLIFDVEVSPNRAMVGFLNNMTGKIKQFEHDEDFSKYIEGHTLVGFNSNKYDDIILTAMMNGASAKDIYKISFDLIEGEGRPWDYAKEVKSIDLMEIAPGQASLKLYGARLHTKQLQDLPYGPHEKHSKKMWKDVCKYNKIDLQVTKELHDHLLPQLNLREKIGKQYHINVMSRSDAQIAEDIFAKELGSQVKKVARNSPKEILYKAPTAVKFKSKKLRKLVQRIEDTVIEVGKSGSPIMPKWLKDEVITIGKQTYNIGLGGLHSMEKSQAVVGDLGNVDVASMYPSMIIALGLYPKHLGKEFLDVYTKIRDTRMKAKKEGNKVIADTLKIVLNGSYGKFGSIYSFLYAPDLMLQVTFTGQLYLLMLIEAFEDAGIEVISSNTDGIELHYKKKVQRLVEKWEKRTGLDMEYGRYKGLYSRDVNSYIAVYDGYVKSKGFYGEPTISKNMQHPIVTEAIREFLLNGTALEDTINNCIELTDFCISRTVTGGALWSSETYPNTEEYANYISKGLKQNKALEKRNEIYQRSFVLAESSKWYLGKVVRFYYSTDGHKMYYAKSGNTVPLSEGSRPMMKLAKKIPKDLDYGKYIELAKQYLGETGYE